MYLSCIHPIKLVGVSVMQHAVILGSRKREGYFPGSQGGCNGATGGKVVSAPHETTTLFIIHTTSGNKNINLCRHAWQL